MGKNKKVKYMEEIIEKKLNHLIKHHLKRVSMKPIDHVKNQYLEEYENDKKDPLGNMTYNV